MRAINIASVAKLGWRAIHESAPWAVALRSKYLASGKQLWDPYPFSSSYTWCSIAKGASVVRDGAQWRVGNGRRINFWTDLWLGSAPLLHHVLAPLSDDELGLKVIDYWGANGSWDWAKLSNCLSPIITALLQPVVVRPGVENPDILVWKHSPHGKFTTKSTYLAIRQHDGHVETELDDWKLIWKARGPNRWKFFTWLARSDSLLTDSLKYQRHLVPDSSCSLCPHHHESSLHALRDCTRARCIWQEIIPPSHWLIFFSLPLIQWVDQNLRTPLWNSSSDSWPSLFMAAISSLWYWRNQQVHNAEFTEPFQPVALIKARAHEFTALKDSLIRGACTTSIHVAWQCPMTGWVKINVDGAVAKRSGQAACGGLIRFAQGKWLSGFRHHVGSSSILVAELWGIWKGLQIAWTHGHRRVILETDSAEALQAIQKATSLHPQFNICQEVWELLHQDWVCDVQLIWREANGCADILAKEALGMATQSAILSEAPPSLVLALAFDLQEGGSSRVVRL